MEAIEMIKKHGSEHGRNLAGLVLTLLAGAVMLTWAWKSVAVGVFALPALGFGPALAVIAALMAAGAAIATGARLALATAR